LKKYNENFNVYIKIIWSKLEVFGYFLEKVITISEVMITITELFIYNYIKSDLGHGQFDNINRMITLSVITLCDFHCLIKNSFYHVRRVYNSLDITNLFCVF